MNSGEKVIDRLFLWPEIPEKLARIARKVDALLDGELVQARVPIVNVFFLDWHGYTKSIAPASIPIIQVAESSGPDETFPDFQLRPNEEKQ